MTVRLSGPGDHRHGSRVPRNAGTDPRRLRSAGLPHTRRGEDAQRRGAARSTPGATSTAWAAVPVRFLSPRNKETPPNVGNWTM